MFLKLGAPLLAVLLAVASGGLLGGPMDVDPNRTDVQNALQFAVAQHNKASNDMYISQVARVINAQTQVVSGVNYIFNVDMVRTSCKKGGVEKVCAAHTDSNLAKSQQCQLKVWSQPWTNSIKVVKNTCMA